MGDGDYDTAIQLLQSLGPTYLSQRDVALVYASAFSGRCGLNLVNVIQQLENVGRHSTLFLYFMGLFPGGTDSKIGDCVFRKHSEHLGDYTENVWRKYFNGIIKCHKSGNNFKSRYADTDNDGAADAALTIAI